ncbi:MAG TPA: hypothetical protein VGX48_18685 [Pyrinomonadaceae bacterium]|jgi:septal ring factor EnvC (AmiA/AmiB activator)|nr:hypothetical protein [Pyrinomonadaceae bacterium]
MPGQKKQHWVIATLQWAGPLVLSCVVAYGSVQYAQGSNAQRLATVERDIQKATAEHSHYVTRDEFKLILEDLKEIKSDVREVRRSLAR